MRLTDKTLAAALALPKVKAEAIVFDDDLAGFGVRARAGGAGRFIFQYKIGAQQRRITLGSTKALTVTRARASAEDLHAKVRLGQDPAGDKAESQVRAGETFKAILDVYMMQQRDQLKRLSYTQKERHLLKHCRALHRSNAERLITSSTFEVAVRPPGFGDQECGWFACRELNDSGLTREQAEQTRFE